MTFAFYNVENLFDTIDDPAKIDEDFTPTGKLAWNAQRYQNKLFKLAEVFDSLPGQLPAFIGMCEIENKNVLQDLIKTGALAGGHYAIIHQDSPDERGIDAVAIYDTERVKVESSEFLPVALPDEKDPYTRDILHAQIKCGDTRMHVFVNHWPSRSGGQEVSEINRITAANVLGKKIEEIRNSEKDARILIMGDFNDHPNDKSIMEVLHAGQQTGDVLYNYMYDEHMKGEGSYFYKGAWGALDQFMASQPVLTSGGGWYAPASAAHIYKQEFLLYHDKDGSTRPDRSYIGERYNEKGHSDHLPVYIVFQR
jgi:predicted extracellular nuclease